MVVLVGQDSFHRAALQRNRQGFVYAPAAVQAFFEHMVSHPYRLRPLVERARLAAKGQPSISTRIVGLFAAWRPRAIVWRIGPIVVVALDGMLRRGTGSHVGIESREVLPLVADLNTAASIVLIGATRRLITALAHALPDFMFRRAAASMGQARRACAFALQAAATLRNAQGQITRENFFLFSACTSTQPCMATRGGSMQDRQPMEDTPGQINPSLGHFNILLRRCPWRPVR
jgi:hypothetical protein